MVTKSQDRICSCCVVFGRNFLMLFYDTSLYSPNDALIVRNIYIKGFSECLFVKRDQVFPL